MNYIRNQEGLQAFGKRLRILRQQKAMTMQELADMADIEYSQVSRIERGIINTSLSNILALAEALKIHPVEFFEEL